MVLDVQLILSSHCTGFLPFPLQRPDKTQVYFTLSPQRKLDCTHAVPRHRRQCSRKVDRGENVVFVHRKSSSRYDVVLIQSDRERKRA